MSPTESDHLQFRGKDMKECKDFIAAVIKHARAQGKFWDDKWIAELVVASLADDALIWWSSLDDETQGSWKLLRYAMASGFRPIFHGKSGAEAEDFVFQIRRRALRAGKLNDPQWTAEFASGCFAGSALRWYASLDPGVQANWASLQRAIFTRYGQESKEESPPTIPVAPPAKQRSRCRIRVVRKGDLSRYYLSRNGPNMIFATFSIGEALEVEYEAAFTSDAPQALNIPDNQIRGFNRLGMKWRNPNLTSTDNYLFICGVNSSSGSDSIGYSFTGPVLSTPWRIASSANARGAKSVTMVGGSGQRLVLVSPSGIPTNLSVTANPSAEINAELFLEPV